MRSKQGAGINVGGSSILVIFVLLCLTTFATLSMVSANSDYKLTQKAVEASSLYYSADGQAEEMLAQIDAVLQKACAAPREQYLDQVAGGLAALSLEPIHFISSSQEGGTVEYTVPLGDTQELSVSLAVRYDPSGAQRYRVLHWKVVQTASLAFDDDAPLLNLWEQPLF